MNLGAKGKEMNGVECSGGNTKAPPVKTLNCDEVAWVLDILERYKKAATLHFPSISRLPEMAKYSAILELMELLNMDMDESAKYNVSPVEFR